MVGNIFKPNLLKEFLRKNQIWKISLLEDFSDNYRKNLKIFDVCFSAENGRKYIETYSPEGIFAKKVQFEKILAYGRLIWTTGLLLVYIYSVHKSFGTGLHIFSVFSVECFQAKCSDQIFKWIFNSTFSKYFSQVSIKFSGVSFQV